MPPCSYRRKMGVRQGSRQYRQITQRDIFWNRGRPVYLPQRRTYDTNFFARAREESIKPRDLGVNPLPRPTLLEEVMGREKIARAADIVAANVKDLEVRVVCHGRHHYRPR